MLHLESFGHLMAAGSPRSGRSQLLRAIATSLAVGFSCELSRRQDLLAAGGSPGWDKRSNRRTR